VLHVPPVAHVTTLLPVQAVCPGAQLPRHDPLEHVWFTHGAGSLHRPSGEQVCTPLFAEQIVLPAAHAPEHCAVAPEATHDAVDPHDAESPHAPLDVHVCTPSPLREHCVCPGAHSVQTPPTHPFVQATAPVHADSVPSGRQVRCPDTQGVPARVPPSGVVLQASERPG
jgi:hypothetical protein